MATFAKFPVVLAAAGVLLSAGAATAEEPVETALKAWVAAIDASPNWTARFAGLTYDPAANKATLSGLAIMSEPEGLAVDFNTITVAGYVGAAGGGFTAGRITADGGAVRAGPVSGELSDIELNELTVPAMDAVAWDADHPFTSLMRAYRPLIGVKLTNGRMGVFTVIQKVGDIASRISYKQFRIDRWADGKIAAVTAGPLEVEAPDPKGLMKMRVASVEGRDFDLGAFIKVYDPDAYVGGVGDGVWRPVMSLAAYRDFTIDGPGLRMSMKLLALENFKLRQPRESFLGFLDKAMADPDTADHDKKGTARAAMNMISAFGIGRLGISQFDVKAAGIDTFHLGGFNLSELSSDGLGEFAIDDLKVAVRDTGSLALKRFAFGGLVFPGVDALMEAVEAEENGDDIDVRKLIPRLGFLEAAGIDLTTPDLPRSKLGKLRLDLKNYLGPVPTSASFDLAGLDVPVSLLGDDDPTGMLKALGYERIVFDYGFRMDWKESDESLTVDGFRFAMKDLGTLNASAAFTGVKRSAIENVETLPDVLGGVMFKSGALSFKDDSILRRGFAMQARKMKVDPDRFREVTAGGLPMMLSVLKNPEFQKRVAPVLQEFIRRPGLLSITATPATPVAVSAIQELIETAPETLPDLLQIKVTGEAGPAPQPPKSQTPTTTAP